MHGYNRCLFILALTAVLATTWGHEHDKQHSHLCEGAGFNLFCQTGQTLRIDKAWYGRIAHDPTSCTGPTPGGADKNHTADPQPDLAEDCGSSLLDSKSSWCKTTDNGGCSIAVQNLEPAVEEKKCPDTVTNKYLYLEYECQQAGGGSRNSGGVVSYFVLLGLVTTLLRFL